MSDSNEQTDTKSGASRGGTLTLKRPVVEQSKVKQSFSHGRTKTVVVETKRKRFGDDRPQAEPAKPQFQVQPKVAAPSPAAKAPSPAVPGVPAARGPVPRNPRYVTLPNEAHGYAARESNLDVIAEMVNWLDKYVKNAGRTTTSR